MKRTLITNGKLLASSLVISMAFSSTAMAQAKSTSTTPQVDVDNAQPNAISYGSTRDNKKHIAAPTGETPDVGDVTERANINTSRSNKLSSGIIVAPSGETTDVGDTIKPANTYGATRPNPNTAIAAPAGCVTEAGAKDVNCDGVDDAPVKAEEGKTDILFRRPGRLE